MTVRNVKLLKLNIISEAEIKLLNVSSLVKKLDFDAKIPDIEGKYFTTSDYNKLTGGILDSKIKQKDLVNKSDISNLVEDSDWNTNFRTSAWKKKKRVKSRTR